MSLGAFSAFMSSVTWAIGSTAYARVAATHSPSSINFTRAVLALSAFLLTMFIVPGILPTWRDVTFAQVGWLSLSMVACYGIGDACFLVSTRSLGGPAALAIASAFPLWSALAGWLWFSEPLTWIQFAAVCAVVMGVVTVILTGARLERPAHYTRGILLAVAASFFWAFNTVAVSRGSSGLHPVVSNTIRMVAGLLLCPWVGVCMSGRPGFLLERRVLKKYGWIFLAESYGGAVFFVYGLANTPLAVAAPLSSLAPVLATPIAWATRREPISLWKFFGICLVVFGAYWLMM